VRENLDDGLGAESQPNLRAAGARSRKADWGAAADGGSRSGAVRSGVVRHVVQRCAPPSDAPSGSLRGRRRLSVADRGGEQFSLKVSRYADEAAVLSAIDDRKIDGAFVAGPSGAKLIVVPAAGAAGAAALGTAFTAAAAALNQKLVVVSAHPLPPGDTSGGASFFVVMALIIGGYLSSTIGLAFGGRATKRGRLAALAIVAVLGALFTDTLAGHTGVWRNGAGAVPTCSLAGAWPASAGRSWHHRGTEHDLLRRQQDRHLADRPHRLPRRRSSSRDPHPSTTAAKRGGSRGRGIRRSDSHRRIDADHDRSGSLGRAASGSLSQGCATSTVETSLGCGQSGWPGTRD
jgi:hypothetical protein